LSSDTICAEAINLVEIQAHPAEALAALLEVVQRQGETIREHEMRLDKQSEYIRELRFKEEPEPGPVQKDRREILQGLLIVNSGKMFAQDARKQMAMDEASFSRFVATMDDILVVKKSNVNKRKNLLILRSAKG
jgi:hypothetical protein